MASEMALARAPGALAGRSSEATVADCRQATLRTSKTFVRNDSKSWGTARYKVSSWDMMFQTKVRPCSGMFGSFPMSSSVLMAWALRTSMG